MAEESSSAQRLLSPIADVDELELGLAPRLSDLNGTSACFVDNGQPGVSIFLERLATQISKRYRLSEVVRIRKARAGKACSPEDLQRAGQCHLVIAGIGL